MTNAYKPVAVLTALLFLSGCQAETTQDALVDRGHAVDVLRSAVVAAARDGDSLCDLAAAEAECLRTLERVGPPPGDDPVVACGRRIDSGPEFADGYLLVVEGRQLNARSYVSDFFVFRDVDGRLIVQDPVYWSGARFAAVDTNHVTETEGGAPSC